MWNCDKTMEDTKLDEGTGSGSNFRRVQGSAECWGLLRLALETWLHVNLPTFSYPTNQGHPPPELVVKHSAAHHPAHPQVRSSMRVCLNRHWGEESLLWPSRGKEKRVQRPWSRVPGKPRETRHCVLKWQQNDFVTELLSYIPIRQNKHIRSKQRKAQELYSIVCGHNSLTTVREGPGGGVVF